MNKSIKITLVSGLVLGTVSAKAQIIYSNNANPGDNFTNAGGTAANQMLSNFAGPSGEAATYRETKNNGTIGINTNLARSGNGSAWISTDGTTNGKSEIALSTAFTAAGDSNGSLGSFDSLSAFGVDLYTQSSSVSNLAAIVRLELFSATDGGGKYGQLVFDTTWNPGHFGTFAFGQWNTEDFMANAGSMWFRGSSSLGATYDPSGSERTLADWMSTLNGKGYQVLSMNAGMGSSNTVFQGAVDNFKLGFGGSNKTYNFEAVPEPASICAIGLGILALIRKRRSAK